VSPKQKGVFGKNAVAIDVSQMLHYNIILKWCITFSGLAKVAIFTTNVDAKNQSLINHKTVCGAMNRHFCQTRVIASAFISMPLLL